MDTIKFLAVFVLAVLASGCSAIRCSTDAECGAGDVCDRVSHMCVPASGGGTAPNPQPGTPDMGGGTPGPRMRGNGHYGANCAGAPAGWYDLPCGSKLVCQGNFATAKCVGDGTEGAGCNRRNPDDRACGASLTCNTTCQKVNAPPIQCHGLQFSLSAQSGDCRGYDAGGNEVWHVPSPMASQVVSAPNGVCSVTCLAQSGSETVVPQTCSGTWTPGATTDVPRWTTNGCAQLPGHPNGSVWGRGCAWDGRCMTP